MPHYTVYRTTFEGAKSTRIGGVDVPNNKETVLLLTEEQHAALKADKTITTLDLVKDDVVKGGK